MIFASSSTSGGGLFPLPLVGANVFVRKDGSYQVIKHNGLDAGKIAWTEHGIFYSETNSNNWLTTGSLKSTPHENHQYLDGLVVTKDGNTAVTAFNVGFREKGYANHITVSSPSGTTEKTTYGVSSIQVLAACDNKVVSLSADLDVFGKPTFHVDQVTSDGFIQRTPLFKAKLKEETPFIFFAGSAPCLNNKISTLNYLITENSSEAKNISFSSLTPDEQGKLSLPISIINFDINSLSQTTMPLRTPNGASIELSPDEYIRISIDPNSIDSDGNLLWVAGNGIVYKTETTTGITTILNDDFYQASNYQGEKPYWVYASATTETRISILFEDISSWLKHPRLVSIDRQTGKTLADVTLTGLRDKLGDLVFIQDMAANPNTTIP